MKEQSLIVSTDVNQCIQNSVSNLANKKSIILMHDNAYSYVTEIKGRIILKTDFISPQ